MSTPKADNAPAGYLDVWLRIPEFDDEGNENDEAEANTREIDGGRFIVDWSLTAVGLIKSSPEFDSYHDAETWLEAEGFENYSA